MENVINTGHCANSWSYTCPRHVLDFLTTLIVLRRYSEVHTCVKEAWLCPCSLKTNLC